jgi:iron complex outermembrane receptor protein
MEKLFWKIALVVMLLPLTAISQITLTGVVKDKKTSTTLPGAHIVVDKLINAVVTDSDGKFIIKNLHKGKCHLKVSYIGYSTFTQQFNINNDTSIVVELSKSILLGDEVVITALRADNKTPVTYSVIEAEELNKINFGKDIPLLIDNTPSAVSTSDAGTGIGYSGLRIRGTDMTGINVTINGVPFNDPESHQAYWVDLPDFTSSVNNIQVQRGVGTSTNGAAAFGASINIQSNSPSEKAYANLSSSYGSFNTIKNTIAGGTGIIDNKWAFDGRFSRITSDGYIDRAFSDLTSFYFGGGYFGKKHIIQFKAWSGLEETYQAWNGVPKDSLENNRTFNSYNYENQIDYYKQDNYQLTWTYELPKKWIVNTTLHYTKGKGYYEEFKEDKKFTDYQLNNLYIGNDTIKKTDLIQQRWLDNDFTGIVFSIIQPDVKKLQFTFGGAANYYSGDHFGKVIWSKYASDGNINHEWYRGKGIKSDANVYVKSKWEAINNLFFYGDLQSRLINYEITGIDKDLRDISQIHEYLFFNPKAGLVYLINNNNKIYTSFAVANREPSRKTFTDANPVKPQPKAEQLYNYEAGYEFKNSKFLAALNLYIMNYKDQLVMTGEINDVGGDVMTNVSESYRRGIEFLWGVKVLHSVTVTGNVGLSTNKITNFTEFIDDWDNWGEQIANNIGTTDISFSPSIIASNNINWEPTPNLNISLTSKYVGKQYIDNTSNDERSLDAYFVNNLNFNYEIKNSLFKNAQLKFSIINVFDELYESNAWVYRYYYNGKEENLNGYFPQAGRHFMLGIEIGI